MKARKAYVVRVGDKFVGPRYMHRILVPFDKAEMFRYQAAARRVAFNKKADSGAATAAEIMTVLITLED